MEYTDRSFVARRYGNREEYLHYTRLAYEKEAAAAQLMKDEDVEPTRSVLHRSAATLAWRCEIYDKAKKLIHPAISNTNFMICLAPSILRKRVFISKKGNYSFRLMVGRWVMEMRQSLN